MRDFSADGDVPTTAGTSDSSLPLAGLRVLDFSRVLAGPFMTMLLGDLGADVVKVEQPRSGDDTRAWGPPFVGPEGAEESTYFLSVNRNKRSVEIDLKDPADRPLVEDLVRWADVLVENFRPGVLARLGMDDAWLEQTNRRLVRLSISGFGGDGPERDRVGYDQILQAEGGVMSMTGEPGGPPMRSGVPIADLAAGLFGTVGVLAALLERHRSGLGQRVSTSLLAGQIGMHVYQGTRYLIGGEVPGRSGRFHPTVAPYGTFEAADGPIVIGVGNDAIWRRFAVVIGLEPTDERFTTNDERCENRPALHALVEAVLLTEPVAAWLQRFTEAGVPAGAVKSLDEVYASAQVRSQGLVWRLEHPIAGTVEVPGNPVRFSRATGSARRPPPLLGEHNEEVRRAVSEDGRGEG